MQRHCYSKVCRMITLLKFMLQWYHIICGGSETHAALRPSNTLHAQLRPVYNGSESLSHTRGHHYPCSVANMTCRTRVEMSDAQLLDLYHRLGTLEVQHRSYSALESDTQLRSSKAACGADMKQSFFVGDAAGRTEDFAASDK